MNWKYKALVQAALSLAPFGERINYMLQRHVMRSLPVSDGKFVEVTSTARAHIDAVRRHLGRDLGQAVFYEFGAGWDLLIPLAFSALGVRHQILVDLRHLVRPELVNDTVQKLAEAGWSSGPFADGGGGQQSLGGTELVPALKSRYGIEYRAPCDARRTGLPARSVDCITSTNTLEHVPEKDLGSILRECHRLLKDDGVMSFRIDYGDHYSYVDPRISAHNFLRYSDRAWAFFSPALQYQNRLRHRDYMQLFVEAGFEAIEEQPAEVMDADLEAIRGLELAKRFAAYAPADLAVRHARVVLRKRSGARRAANGETRPSA